MTCNHNSPLRLIVTITISAAQLLGFFYLITNACANNTLPVHKVIGGFKWSAKSFAQKGQNDIRSFAISPDGHTLLVIAGDHKQRLLVINTEGWKKTREIDLGCANINIQGLQFSHDGHTIAVNCNWRRTEVWDIVNWRKVKTVIPGGQPHFCTNGKLMLTYDTGYRWIDENGYGEVDPVIPYSINPDAVSPDGQYIASGGSNALQVFSTRSNRIIRRISGLWTAYWKNSSGVISRAPSHVTALAFSPDSRTLLAGAPDANLIAFDTRNWTQRYMIAAREGSETFGSASFSPDGRLFTTSLDQKMAIWNTRTHRQVGLYSLDTKSDHFAFIPHKNLLAAATLDYKGALMIWQSPVISGTHLPRPHKAIDRLELANNVVATDAKKPVVRDFLAF